MQISEIDVSNNQNSIKEGLSRQASAVLGLGILACIGLAFVSLASWSVNDPSLSVSSNEPVSNYLGFPGAIFADLGIQFFGLTSALMLIPPALWGWSQLLQQPVPQFRKRLVAFFFASLTLSAGLSTFPVPGSWPLPLGLGGVTGDLILRIPQAVGLEAVGFFALVFGFAFISFGGWLLLISAGLISLNRQSDALNEREIESIAGAVEEEPSWLLGALSHYYYSYFGSRRPRTEQKSGLMGSLRRKFAELTRPEDDGFEHFDTPHNTAPVAAPAGDPHVDHSPVIAEYGENSYGMDAFQPGPQVHDPAEDWQEQAPPQPEPLQAANPAAARVQTMAPPPKPSTRVQREAQPSLIHGPDFELPSLHFLQEVPASNRNKQLSPEALEQNARMLEGVLQDFGVKGEIINVRPGPVVTLYELEPAPGIKSSRVIGLADDIARSMSAIAARVAVVPGRNAIGIELPNASRETVYLREILASETYESSKAKLPLILGKTIGGEPTIADLAKMPHLLVAGTTGSGKSVAINTMILSILYRMNPEQVKMIMIDPKMLELSIYDGIPHLLTPVVTDPKKAVVALKWTVREMEERYKKMSKIGVRNIDGFNSRVAEARKKNSNITRTIQTGFDQETGEAIYETEEMALEPMPYIVVIIDEMADLMMVAGKDIEGTIQRLAQMARAAGIHVIMATQRPSVDVITGTIKANFPTRISFQVTSKIDSRTILGEQGAEQLLGMGDMLYMAGGGRIQRVHGPFVDDSEVDQVVQHLKSQGVPQYLDSVTEEEDEGSGAAGSGAGDLSESNDIYDQAVAVVLRDRKVSTSYIQRRLSIGYNRAASLIERMEQEGLISPANHAGKREILVPGEDETI